MGTQTGNFAFKRFLGFFLKNKNKKRDGLKKIPSMRKEYVSAEIN